jgi:hypothetical protein
MEREAGEEQTVPPGHSGGFLGYSKMANDVSKYRYDKQAHHQRGTCASLELDRPRTAKAPRAQS